ncbi:hypothetical protein LZ017_20870 [Pelomonas sp. CA6]|uniref:O-linked N-acetylglucosamine transferase, SPINDLY family protein n=1 Tax=Pelomonas sp. CA6 TaxID=2907999 RepID=UPI001F4C2090|nr:tetratricopeptide repeat protein [Pelomonas sp. CA6]MCH7345832.1 hypothetical protein [Pelomonas sp. CA6]
MPPSASPSSNALAQLLTRAQTLLQNKQWRDGATLLRQALRQQPEDGGLWLTLARTLRAAQLTREAMEAAEQAMRHAARVDHAQAATLLAAQAAMALNEHARVVAFASALPGDLCASELELLKLHGAALNRLGRSQEAIPVLMQALALKIDERDAYIELGFAFYNLKMHAESAECFRTVTVLHPTHLGAQAYLIHLEQHACQWQDYEPRRQALLDAQARAAQDPLPQFSVPFTLVSLPHEPQQMLEAARMTSRYLSQNIVPLPPAAPRAPRATRRLRIGYLSNDLQSHATATLIAQVLEEHDRERFEILLFSHAPDDGSAMRQRLIAACDRFEDVLPLGLPDTARRIRELEVDLLVDLKGHTAGSRLPVLAYRPAPVQVGWLGFPGTCGLDAVDYVIGDPEVTPLAHAPFYSEKIAQMPICYQPNDGRRARGTPPPRAALGLPEQAIVLLGANQVYKLNPPLFDAWMEILRRVPAAVLWQLAGSEPANAALRDEVARRGIDPRRLVLMPKADLAEHAARLGAADLALDTWPCNGHTTTSDALWAGVPVITRRGEGFAARVAASLLQASGLPELICDSSADYVALACRLADDAVARNALRERLLAARDSAALFNAQGFARDLEALYERMWARHEAGLPPEALPAAAASAHGASA